MNKKERDPYEIYYPFRLILYKDEVKKDTEDSRKEEHKEGNR